MLKKTLTSIQQQRRRHFSSSPESQSLYSFLKPSLFSNKPISLTPSLSPPPQSSKTLTPDQKASLESTLHHSLTITHDTDEAWKAFRSLTAASSLPEKPLLNSLITHLSESNTRLKRAFASAAYVIEKDPTFLESNTLLTLFRSLKLAKAPSPALALVKCMFKNRFFVPFHLWGSLIISTCRETGTLVPFLKVFNESCRVSLDEKLDYMKPNLEACNAALEACCLHLESLPDAESVIESMSVIGVKPDESTFGFLGYLYARKGLKEKIKEIESLMHGFGFVSKRVLYSNMISGYVKVGDLDSVSDVILQSLCSFSEETYCEIVKGFIESKKVKSLATLIIKAQRLESECIDVDRSVGFGIINACVKLGFSDKAHSVLEEMIAQGGEVGLGVYLPILKAYSKEYKTAEATQLVTEISGGCSGLELEVGIYNELIEASMTNQDFVSAFTLFRDMREARGVDLLRENLPLAYRQQIVEFILQNSGQKDFNFNPSFRDPFTGANAYVPGQSSHTAATTAKPLYKHIPKRGVLVFDVAQYDGIVKKMTEFNNTLRSDPVHTDKSLTEVEISRVGAMVKILKDTSHYHATSFADMDISLLLKVLQAWPPAMMFPATDLVRMLVLHPHGASLLIKHVENNNDLLLDVIKKVTEDSALPANLLTTVRVLVNLFKNPSFHYWLQRHHSQILDAFSNCYSSPNKNLQLAYSTLLLNYAVLLIEKKDQEGQAQVLSAALQIAEEEAADVDSKFRSLVAIGSLMLEGLVKKIAIDFEVESIAKSAKASKEAKIVEVGADIDLVIRQP